MATFDIVRQNALLAGTSFDLAVLTAEASLDRAMDDIAIFLEEAEFKVMNEGGTEEDMEYYREQSSEGFIATAKEVILKIIDAIKTFFSELKEKAIKLFASKDIDMNIEKVEKKISMNPFLKNKKVKIDDHDAKLDAIKDHKNNLGKLLARMGAGENVSVDEVDKENERFNKAWIAAGAATITLTFVAILEAVRKGRAQLADKIGKVEDDINERMKSAKEKVEKMANPETASAFSRTCSSVAKAAKKEGECTLNKLLDMWKAVKSAVSRSRDSDEDVFDESTESTFEDVDFDDDIVDDIGDEDIDEFVSAFTAASGVGEEDEYPVDDIDEDDADIDVPVYAGEIEEGSEDDVNIDKETDPNKLAKEALKEDKEFKEGVGEDEDISLESVSDEMDELFADLKDLYAESSSTDCCTECGEAIAEGAECYATEGGNLICEACWKSKE